MPTETFLRLPQEKRNRFLDAAWEAFTDVAFADVSINQIVRQAGIPRGSFYQYFADKEDLFFLLMGDVHDHFVREMGRLLREAGGDMFAMALLSYDYFLCRDGRPNRALGRCLRILRANPGLDVLKLVSGEYEKMPEELWTQMELSAFRRQDRDFGWQAFSLTILALSGAIMSGLTRPENAPAYRSELEERLDIIRRGCLAPDDETLGA